MKSYKKFCYAALGLLLAFTMLLASACATKVQAQDLMEGVTAAEVPEKPADEAFIREGMRFSLALFQAAAREEREKGTSLLLSPLSVELALAMTANGAKGQTREEMLSVLGGDLSMEELNAYLHTYETKLEQAGEKAKLHLANSIWYRDDPLLTVREAFLQTNADYYGAGAFKAAFDQQTVKDINHWIDEQKDGLIKKMVEKIEDEDMLFLINTILFDAEWWDIYTESQVRPGVFTARDGTKQTATYMHSTENWYYDDGKALGFRKSYKTYTDRRYSFVALLPNEGIDVFDYVAELTPEGLLETLQNGKWAQVTASIPKFESGYDTSLREILTGMGMPTAFNGDYADFTDMATYSDTDRNLYIADVLHKTFITVDERGTKAGAATVVEMAAGTSEGPEKRVEITLDRPFVYLIMDDETQLPLFIGVQTEVE